MKLAFNREAHYPDFNDGYELYRSRARSGECVSFELYKKIIKEYCKNLSNRLLDEGYIELPARLGSICTASMYRKPQYRGKKFIGYGKKDWNTGYYDGSPTAFGIVFFPRHDMNNNLRSYGFVANRQLFKKVKWLYESDYCPWIPVEFNDELI